MAPRFYSNGKLLLTGEYVVLDGATALALPTKYGQDLVIENGNGRKIHWISFDSDNSIWFEDFILFSEILGNANVLEPSVKATLIKILHEAFLLDPGFIDNSEGYRITTNLGFPRKWGLGTSSTLINNIAQWLQLDAFILLHNSFGGSGYDIACAQNDGPVLYRLRNGRPMVEKINFEPSFSDRLYFVYLNKKQNSKSAIASYYKKQNDVSKILPVLDMITHAILEADNLEVFSKQIEKHETIMGRVLGTPTVKATLFPDFKGSLKSLGAWGGDFILAMSDEDPAGYFRKKGYETIVKYNDMVL
jgi:mevalonate kinase